MIKLILLILLICPCFAKAAPHYNLILSTNSEQVEVNLWSIIKAIYPDIINIENCRIGDVGNRDNKGPYIEWWNYVQPQPTKAEIESKLKDGYALQKYLQDESKNKQSSLDAQWAILKDEGTTDEEWRKTWVEMEKIRRGE